MAGYFDDMPALVDPDSVPFIPPPPGAAHGGQPITYTPYPTVQPSLSGSPWLTTQQPPHSAPAWLTQPQPEPFFFPQGSNRPYAPTPAGSWGGVPTPPGSFGPPTPASAHNYPAVNAAYHGEQEPHAVAAAASFTSPWYAPHPEYPIAKSKSIAVVSPSIPPADPFFPLQRSLSVGAPRARSPYPHPGYAHPIEEYNARNLARRPREWRPDYDPREGLASFIPRVIKPSSDVREYTDPVKRSPHEFLAYPKSKPSSAADVPILFDLRTNPLDPYNTTLSLPRLNRRLNTLDFAQLATQPTAPVLRLFHPALPWYVDVFQSHPSGVTVHDVLWQLYTQLDQQILGKDWFNECLTDTDRARMAECFQERVEGREEEMRRGIKRVDFLRGKVVFEGLVRGKGGMWEIKTRTWE